MNFVQSKVYLIGRPSLTSGLFQYLMDEGINHDISVLNNGKHIGTPSDPDSRDWKMVDPITAAELLCMSAGKVCYDAFGKGRSSPEEYFDHILSSGHGSILEHAQWNFLITGVSRTFSHEHVRHRVGTAISQRSQRYVKESNANIIPQEIIQENPHAKEIFEHAIENSQKAYDALVDLLSQDLKDTIPDSTLRIKTARSAARSVMPNATETVIFWSANARALRHYINLRASIHAEVEIRSVAIQLLRIMQKEAPSLFSDFVISKESDTEVAASKYSV